MSKSLESKVALVAGATRGAGRGIAVELGASGATVYCTGRTTRDHRSELGRPETIEETAELVTAAGGQGIAVRVDHLEIAQVRELLERIDTEQHGRLDILVNDVWGGEGLVEWGRPFWEHDLDNGLRMLHNAVDTHIITTWHAAKLMVKRQCGLIVEITDGEPNHFHDHLLYDLAKKSVMRLAVAYAEEMRRFGITGVAVSPGWLRSESMLERMGVTEDDWQEFYWRRPSNPRWLASETPRYTGRAIAALAADPNVSRWNGQSVHTRDLATAYRFTDLNGTRPGHGIFSIEHLDGQPPCREDYARAGGQSRS